MNKLITILLLAWACVSANAHTNTTAQTDTITFAGTFDNKEYNVYLTIDFYHNNVVVPNQEIFGEMAGYFGDKRDNRKWLFTSAEITDSTTATINITNDYGSEDLVATLSKQENGTFMLIQEKGSTLKIARNSKWVKLPKSSYSPKGEAEAIKLLSPTPNRKHLLQ